LKRSKSIMKKRITHLTISLFLVFSFPVSALADTTPDSSAATPASSAPGTSTATPSPSSPETPPAAAPTPAPNTATTTPPASSPQAGPSAPTGADANTYTYNATTGLWENQFYTWDPVTHQTSPKTPRNMYTMHRLVRMYQTLYHRLAIQIHLLICRQITKSQTQVPTHQTH
jgi:hypothetical protein